MLFSHIAIIQYNFGIVFKRVAILTLGPGLNLTIFLF